MISFKDLQGTINSFVTKSFTSPLTNEYTWKIDGLLKCEANQIGGQVTHFELSNTEAIQGYIKEWHSPYESDRSYKVIRDIKFTYFFWKKRQWRVNIK